MKWNVKDRKYFKPYLVSTLNQYRQIGVGPVMAKVLMNRDCNYDDIKRLLTDPADCLEDPTDICGCVEAGNAIVDIIGSGMKVWIFADYDVDGLTAGYIMTNYLKDLGVDVNVYYPERKEGYGLNVQFLQTLQEGCAVITVDNGISAINAIHYCKENGIPLVITDHHKPLVNLEDVIVCDPYLNPEGTGHHLCGAAVAWKICQYLDSVLFRNEAWKFTPYVALGTIADVMPMNLENMVITRVGLELISQGLAPNILEFLKYLGVKEPTVEDIAWKLAPALNACGRLGSINLARDFLYFTGAKNDLQKIIVQIDNLNRNRKNISADAIRDAISCDYDNDSFCLFDATNYPSGISGIIAGKLVETFNKPAIVYNRNKSSVWTGSMRSNGFDILPYLEREKNYGHIYDYGGHSQACGVMLLPDIKSFKESLNGAIRVPLQEFNKQEKTINIDTEITLADINVNLYKDIVKIPTDRSLFPQPVFIVRNLRVHEVYHSSNNPNNIRLTVVDESKELYKFWAWGKDPLYQSLGNPKYIDIVGTVGPEFGKNSNSITFNVEDIKCCS